MITQHNGAKKNNKDEHLHIANNIIQTTIWINNQEKKVLENSGITLQQKNILQILSENGKALSTLEIRKKMPDSMSDTSRIVDRLLAKGLVTKNLNATDKRRVDVSITAKGRKLITKLNNGGSKLDDLLRILSQAEAKALNKYLVKLRESNE